MGDFLASQLDFLQHRISPGFIDVAHFAWIHHHSFADRRNPVVPNYTVERRDNGMRADFSWQRQGKLYELLYERLLAQPGAQGG